MAEIQQGISDLNEQPVYVLPQIKKRLLVPKIIIFIFLGMIFYAGVLLNISLLELASSTEMIIRLASLFTLMFLITSGIIINIVRSRKNYLFYSDRIIFRDRQILLDRITGIKQKRSLLDKIFRTYSITLNEKFRIENISREIQLQDYIERLISYSRRSKYSDSAR